MAMNNKKGFMVVLVTTPGREDALNIAENIVAERLCACCNILEGVSSVFVWKGSVEREDECLMIIKTSAARYEELEERIKSLHDYDVPEIIALPLVAGNSSYLEWIEGVLEE